MLRNYSYLLWKLKEGSSACEIVLIISDNNLYLFYIITARR